MSLADAGGPAAGLPDHGTIHEWLDGQLDDASSEALEQLCQSSAEFAAQVAEARGFTALASRVLLALDDPAAERAAQSPKAAVASITSARSAQRGHGGGGSTGISSSGPASAGGSSWRRWASVAAVLMVGATGVYMVQGPLAERSAPTAPVNSGTETRIATEFPTAAEIQQLASAGAIRTRESDAGVLGVDAPVGAASPRDGNAQVGAASPMRANAQGSAAAPLGTDAQPSTTASLGSDVQAGADAPSGTDVRLGASGARALSSGDGNESATDVLLRSTRSSALFPDNERAFAVQRVQCTPNCVQERREVAVDGRVAHVVLQPSGREPRRGAIDSSAVRVLSALADSLQIQQLPAVLRLNASACQAVGNLRESLRLELRVGNVIKAITAVPWCASENDPFHHITRAVERTVEQGLR